MGTPNLDLKNDYADSDVTTRATYNSPVDYLDRAVEWFERFAGHGVESGWELQSDKTVSAGSGVVNHFWHQTAGAQPVTGWTYGVANYVNAHPSLSVDPASGNVAFGVTFSATTSEAVPAGAVPIASCALDSSGAIVGGSISHARKRHAYNYQWVVLTLSISRTGIGAGETVTETIPLGATLYGGYTVELPGVPGFSVKTHSYEPMQFQIDVTNETAYPGDYGATATVRGISGL